MLHQPGLQQLAGPVSRGTDHQDLQFPLLFLPFQRCHDMQCQRCPFVVVNVIPAKTRHGAEVLADDFHQIRLVTQDVLRQGILLGKSPHQTHHHRTKVFQQAGDQLRILVQLHYVIFREL